jgi:hypothetical protein
VTVRWRANGGRFQQIVLNPSQMLQSVWSPFAALDLRAAAQHDGPAT